MRPVFRSTALALLLAFGTVSTSGCLGKMALFNKVQDWNGTLGDKWINSVVHFGLWITLVYPVTVVGDVLLFNTIEFWSGDNPVASNGVSVSEDGETVAVRFRAEDSDYLIESRRNEPAHVYRDGTLIGMGEPTDDGQGWIFHDLEGGQTRVASPDELAAALPAR